METELTLKTECPQCGGMVDIFVGIEATHAGNGEVEINYAEATIGEHKCPGVATN